MNCAEASDRFCPSQWNKHPDDATVSYTAVAVSGKQCASVILMLLLADATFSRVERHRIKGHFSRITQEGWVRAYRKSEHPYPTKNPFDHSPH